MCIEMPADPTIEEPYAMPDVPEISTILLYIYLDGTESWSQGTSIIQSLLEKDLDTLDIKFMHPVEEMCAEYDSLTRIEKVSEQLRNNVMPTDMEDCKNPTEYQFINRTKYFMVLEVPGSDDTLFHRAGSPEMNEPGVIPVNVRDAFYMSHPSRAHPLCVLRTPDAFNRIVADKRCCVHIISVSRESESRYGLVFESHEHVVQWSSLENLASGA
jgi:hypothetical protein